MTPYEREFLVTTTDSNQVVALNYPGRCTLDHIGIVLLGGGTVTANIYNRAFVGPAIPIYLITVDNGSVMLQVNQPLAVREGDVITVAGAAAAEYNVSHRIVQRIDDYNFITDQPFTVNSLGGTAQLNIPSAEQELYRVTPQISASSPTQTDLAVTYVNRDALPNNNIGVNRKVYILLTTQGSYRITIRSHESIGVSM